MDSPPTLEVVHDSRIGFAASTAIVKLGLRADFWLSVGEGLAFGFVLYGAAAFFLGADGLSGAVLGFALTWMWFCLIRAPRTRRRLMAMWAVPPYRLSLDDQGITAASETGSVWRAWNRVSSLIERETWVAIAFDGLEVLAIPASSFPNTEAREIWLQYVHARIPGECVVTTRA